MPSYLKPERKFMRKQHRKLIDESGGDKKKAKKKYNRLFPKPTGVKVFMQHGGGKKVIHTSSKGSFSASEIKKIRKGKGLLKK